MLHRVPAPNFYMYLSKSSLHIKCTAYLLTYTSNIDYTVRPFILGQNFPISRHSYLLTYLSTCAASALMILQKILTFKKKIDSIPMYLIFRGGRPYRCEKEKKPRIYLEFSRAITHGNKNLRDKTKQHEFSYFLFRVLTFIS